MTSLQPNSCVHWREWYVVGREGDAGMDRYGTLPAGYCRAVAGRTLQNRDSGRDPFLARGIVTTFLGNGLGGIRHRLETTEGARVITRVRAAHWGNTRISIPLERRMSLSTGLPNRRAHNPERWLCPMKNCVTPCDSANFTSVSMGSSPSRISMRA